MKRDPGLPELAKRDQVSIASETFCSLILLPSASGIDTVPIFSIWITYPAAVIKLMFLALLLINRLVLLQKWQDA